MIGTPLIDSSFIMQENETSAHQLFSEVAAQVVTLVIRGRKAGM